MLQQLANLINNNQIQQACALCEQIKKKYTRQAEFWRLYADVSSKIGNQHQAKEYLKKSIKIDPGSSSAHTMLGMIYHREKNAASALKHYRHSLSLNNNQPAVHFNAAAIYQETDDIEKAVKHYNQAIKLNPGYAIAYANLAYIYRQQGQLDASIENYKQAATYAPEIAAIHYNLGLALYDKGLNDEALSAQKKALSINQDYADAMSAMGQIYFDNHQLELAEKYYKAALSKNTSIVDAHIGLSRIYSKQEKHEKSLNEIDQALHKESNTSNNTIELMLIKGSIYLEMGKPESTIECCNEILAREPNHTRTIALVSSAYEKTGDYEKSYEIIKPFIDNDDYDYTISLAFAAVCSHLSLTEQAIQYINKNNIKSLKPSEQVHIHFALGKLYDSIKDYENAFTHYEKANNLKGMKYNHRAFTRLADNIISTFTKSFIDKISKPGSSTDITPVFIVGMPRSGTTLVEHIISSHSEVEAGGELPYINNIFDSIVSNYSSLPYPDVINSINNSDLKELSDSYINNVRALSNNKSIITDKMPGNFIHLGLIEILLPNAKIILCERDPLDTSLSCFFQDFHTSHPWCYNLNDIHDFYTQYIRIVKHYLKHISLPVLRVKYEDIINDKEMQIKRIMDFCELDLESLCYNSHSNTKLNWTASYQQVRKPIYTTSVARWKHYQSHIKPILRLNEV